MFQAPLGKRSSEFRRAAVSKLLHYFALWFQHLFGLLQKLVDIGEDGAEDGGVGRGSGAGKCGAARDTVSLASAWQGSTVLGTSSRKLSRLRMSNSGLGGHWPRAPG